MFSPMYATHTIVKTTSGPSPKSKNDVNKTLKSNASINLPREEDPAKKHSKSKILSHFSDRYGMRKSSSRFSKAKSASGEGTEELLGDANRASSKEKPDPSEAAEEDEASIKSNIGLKRKVVDSHESIITITAEAEQYLSRADVRSIISSAVDPSEITVSSEASNGESSKVASSIQSCLSTPAQSRIDSSGICRSDWAAGALPSRDNTPENSERPASEKQSAADSAASVCSENSHKSQSFVTRSLDIPIEDNPSLEHELNVIKAAVQEKEEDPEAIKSAAQGEVHKEVLEAMLKIQKLENRLMIKEELLGTAYERIDELEAELNTVATQLNSSKDHIKWLDLHLQKKTKDLETIQRDHGYELTRLDREKRDMLESLQALEIQLGEETFMSDAHKEAKELAIKYNAGLKKHYDFYRGYYDKQETLYHTYFRKERVRALGTAAQGMTTSPTSGVAVAQGMSMRPTSGVAVAQGMTMRPTGGEVKQIEFRDRVMSKSCSKKREENAYGKTLNVECSC